MCPGCRLSIRRSCPVGRQWADSARVYPCGLSCSSSPSSAPPTPTSSAWPGARCDCQGRQYGGVDSSGLPKPVQPVGAAVIVGGKGPKRTPRLAGRYAAEFNAPFASLDETRAAFERVTRACEEAGRTAPITLSAAQTVACGRTEGEARKRAEAVGGEPPLFGTPSQVVDQIGRFAAIGATRLL